MRLLDRWRARSIRRELSDPRHIAVANHTQHLAGLDPAYLLSLVNPDPGAWPIEELETETNSVAVRVSAFCSDDTEDHEVLFLIDHHSRWGRWFADGFAIRNGAISPLTDDDWGTLD